MLDIILIFFTVFLALWWWSSSERITDLPPGPPHSLPLLGHLPLLRKDPRPQFELWRRQYGDVFSFFMANRLVVVLNGYQTIREALVKNADVFSVRPSMFITDLVTHSGIVFNSGPSWKEQRKLTLEILRSLGMGRQKFTDNILKEVHEFLEVVHGHQGRPTDFSQLINVSMSNNICNVVFGRRFEYDSTSFLRYLDLIRDNFRLLPPSNLLNYIPWLRFLPGDWFGAKKVLQNVAEMERSFLTPEIQQHIDRANLSHAPHNNNDHVDIGDDDDDDDDDEHVDFISAYLTHIKRQRANGSSESSMKDDIENLLWTVSDLFVAGTDTLTNALLWTLLYLIHFPRVQDTCFRQIRQVLGTTTPPGACHRLELPYVEATVMETLRISDIGAFGLQHGVSRETLFRGYRIPKDAIVVAFLHTALNDASVWGDPSSFRPERFLDPDTGGLLKKEEFIPFSIGRRSCPGEGIARLQLFLYVTSLIQRFRFLPAEEGQLPSLEGIMEFTHTPEPFLIRAVPRERED